MGDRVEIREYGRILRAGWWIVALATVLGIAAGWAYTLFTTPQYQACARLFVTTEGGSSVGEAYQNNLFSQERVTSYAGLATSAQVAQRAVDQLQLQMSADDLRSRVTATPIEKTVLLDLCATDPDPAVAQVLTNAVAGQLTQVIQELETSQRGAAPRPARPSSTRAMCPPRPSAWGYPPHSDSAVPSGSSSGWRSRCCADCSIARFAIALGQRRSRARPCWAGFRSTRRDPVLQWPR